MNSVPDGVASSIFRVVKIEPDGYVESDAEFIPLSQPVVLDVY